MLVKPAISLHGNDQSVTLLNGAGDFMLLQGATGLGWGPHELTSTALAGGGSVLRHKRVTEAEVMLPIMLGNSDFYQRRANRRTLESLCDGQVEIRVSHPDGWERSRWGTLREGLEGAYGEGEDSHGGQKLVLTFTCPDPWWYGELRDSGDGQRMAEGTIVRENLNTNPRFSDWHVIDTLAQNWVLNPEAQSGTGSYWTRHNSSGMTIQPAKFMRLRQAIVPGVNQAWGYTATDGPANSFLLVTSPDPTQGTGAPVSEGDVVAGGALVYASRAGRADASIIFYDASGNQLSGPKGAGVSVAAGGVEWVSIREIAPTGAARAYLRAGMWLGEHQYPYTVAASAGLLMTSNDSQGDSNWVPNAPPTPDIYFSGNRSMDPDFKMVTWSDDEGASISRLHLARPTAQGDSDDGAMWGGMGTARVSASNRGGVAIVSDGVNTASLFPSGSFDHGAQERLRLFPGTTHLFSVDASLDEPLPMGGVSGLARRISVDVTTTEGTLWGYGTSGVLPNEAGAKQRLTCVVSIPEDATDAQVRLIHGHMFGRIRFDNFLHLELPNGVYPKQSTMGEWFASLKSAGSEPAQVMVIGDSISEGLRIERAEDRWQSRTQATLRAVTGARLGAVWPFIPGYYNSMLDESERYHPLTTEGNVTKSSVIGMSSRAATLEDETAALTYTFTGTSFLVHFENQGTAGTARIVVDGVPVTVDIAGLTEGVWRSGPIGVGEHVVRIEYVSGKVIVGGCTTYDGDETHGVRIIDGARSGMASVHIANDATRAEAYQRHMRVTGPYQLVIIALGTNDYGGEPADSGTNMQAIINIIRQEHQGPIVLLGTAMGKGRDPVKWADFEAAWKQVADANSGVEFASVRAGMADADADGRLYHDALHPNADGHAVMSGVVSALIGFQTPGVFDSYFSGATRPDDGKTYEWVGDVNASTSLERSPDLVGASGPSYPYWPVELSYSSSEETFVLDVTGDAKSWPTWVVRPPGRDALVVNQTTGERIDIRGEIDEEITIVTVPQQQDMITDTKRDGQTWLKATSNTVLFPLSPGPNVVAMSIVNGDARSQISATYRETFKAGH